MRSAPFTSDTPTVWDPQRGVFLFPARAPSAEEIFFAADDPIPAFLSVPRDPKRPIATGFARGAGRRRRARRALLSLRGWVLLTYGALILATIAGAVTALHTGAQP